MTDSARKRAFITGVTGQDGSYLTEFLLAKGYEVHGVVRQSSAFNRGRIEKIYFLEEGHHFHLHYGDLTDSSNLNRLLRTIEPQEIYNLGAQSHVAVSFNVPEYTAEVDAVGTLRLLDAVRETGLSPKFYQASTSELYGDVADEIPQNEKTRFQPRSPYAAAKLFAYWVTVNYREAYRLFATNGILFNHESPRRGESFVTRKITLSIAQILTKKIDHLALGNLNARRDWGYAPEYVEAMWLMLQHEKPDDFVIATNEMHTVREFVEEAFRQVDLEIEWRGSGADEQGLDKKTGKVLVAVDPRYYRPTEVETLQGDYSKAERTLGWRPKTRFRDLVRIMVQADLAAAGIKLS